MCDICGSDICLKGCPAAWSFVPGRYLAVCRCAACNRNILRGETALVREETVLCTDCVESITTQDLMDLGPYTEPSALLADLGFAERVM